MIQNFVWSKLRQANRIPGAYQLFYACANLYLRDGKIVYLRKGPAAGYRWCHHRGYQPWMAFGLYEPSVASLIQKLLKPGDIFYDIGANAGYFTLVGAKAVGETGRVVAFEPMEQDYKMVQRQLSPNDLEQRCVIERLAVADKNSTTQLATPQRNANAHLAEVDAPHIAEKSSEAMEEISCIRLDDYVAKYPDRKPNLIKIDIEGAEVLALAGGANLFRSANAPNLLITAHSSQLDQTCRNMLIDAGYSFGDFADMIYAKSPNL